MQSAIPVVKAMDPKTFTGKFSLGNQKIMIDIFSSPFSSTSSSLLYIYI